MKRRNLHLFQLGVFLASAQGFCEDKTETRISQLESDMRQIGAQTAFGNYGAKTASASPQIDGFDFFITADFLWWKLYEGGTEYVLKDTLPFDSDNINIRGSVKHLNFEWEPGFKVGLGCLLGHDGWDIYLNFTSFETHAHRSSSSNLDALFPLTGVQIFSTTKAHARWHVDFEDIDFVLGRNYFVSKYLALHPFFGLTSAWIQQHRKFQYEFTSFDLKIRGKNNFWGIGPRLGVEPQFYLGRHFSLYGDIEGALLWGHFHVNEKENDVLNDVQYYDFSAHDHRMVPTVRFGLGMAFETNFNHNHNHFMIKLGYEGQYWWRQNRFPEFDVFSFKLNRQSEDLSLQGLTVDFRLDF